MTYETISINTKKMIEQKFKELVCKKPLSKVTISEIIKECGIMPQPSKAIISKH